ncbi:S41 family peptidase [Corynebacterium sp. TAE3-ERU12]|uniref:S41 family peptidase n=1 Tax=Corynebacterium sp. TAE3-ERU12 TaxID=2849491 RepID=UPI00351D4416
MKKWFGAAFAAIVISALMVVWHFGPMVGTALRGKPFFLMPPSPQRYAQFVLDYAELNALYGYSPEYAEAKKEALATAEHAESTEALWPVLAKAVKVAGSQHSNLVPPDEVKETQNSNVEPEVRGGTRMEITVPAYMAGGTLTPEQYANRIAEGIAREAKAGACGAVVDLRGNRGGDMGPMIAGLSPLLPDGTVMSFSHRDGDSPVRLDGNSVTGGGTPTEATAVGKIDLPVAVLVDGDTASSAEAVMLAFRGLDYSRSFGTPTAGYPSANMTIELPDGALLILTIAGDKDRTGQIYLDEPLRPDGGDMDAWLSSQGCS